MPLSAKELGMEVLLEIHDETEIEHIGEEVDFVGVNNRSLKDAGLGIEWEVMQGTKFNMLWAHKLGTNHGRRSDDTNFDKTNTTDMLRFGFTQQF